VTNFRGDVNSVLLQAVRRDELLLGDVARHQALIGPRDRSNDEKEIGSNRNADQKTYSRMARKSFSLVDFENKL